MPLPRLITPEWLDELPALDPRAVRSRRDLRLLNGLMGHVRLMAELLGKTVEAPPPHTLIELGAGDGIFLLRLARGLAPRLGRLKVVLVDRQPAVKPATRLALDDLGWTVEIAEADVFDWLEKVQPQPGTLMTANLFLHHFTEDALRVLLGLVARKAEQFAACEPRRTALALGTARLVGLIGCNSVTRHDAPASVRAGFIGSELSGLWPNQLGWHLHEGEAGLFSHFFVAAQNRS